MVIDSGVEAVLEQYTWAILCAFTSGTEK